MKYKAIFFDLDGTLTNPEEGIINCIRYAAEHYGVTIDRKDRRKYIGPPLVDTFIELLGPDVQQAEEAVAKYRERFRPIGLYENEIYDGVPETLAQLKDMGYVLCTASSKPQRFVDTILEHFDIKKYFDFVGGASMDGKISKKEDVINLVLEETGFTPQQVLMVGDRMFDLTGAKEFGMDAVGVLYGFGSYEELSSYDNIALLDDISQLINILEKV
ncbi:MAG: HAD hydrolase-like protein [Oscillospiraceae bacterium]|nr:HAD hydrolase-like protein [Oscillospiraceae bacterium]